MNKSAELAHLRKLIETLGPDSYIGPWLAQELPSIEHDMRSDFSPLITIAAARAICETMIETATEVAANVVARAEAQAGQIRNRAHEAESRAASNLRDALRTLQS